MAKEEEAREQSVRAGFIEGVRAGVTRGLLLGRIRGSLAVLARGQDFPDCAAVNTELRALEQQLMGIRTPSPSTHDSNLATYFDGDDHSSIQSRAATSQCCNEEAETAQCCDKDGKCCGSGACASETEQITDVDMTELSVRAQLRLIRELPYCLHQYFAFRNAWTYLLRD